MHNQITRDSPHTTNKNNKTMNKVTPNTKFELREIIKKELERQGCDADLNFIDTSNITDMSWLFEGLLIGYIKIDKWDVSNVTNMSHMFECAWYFNCDLSKWDVSKVTNMYRMFAFAYNFTSDLSEWNVSNVKNMAWMFLFAEKFMPNLSKWDVSNDADVRGMLIDSGITEDEKELQPISNKMCDYFYYRWIN